MSAESRQSVLVIMTAHDTLHTSQKRAAAPKKPGDCVRGVFRLVVDPTGAGIFRNLDVGKTLRERARRDACCSVAFSEVLQLRN